MIPATYDDLEVIKKGKQAINQESATKQLDNELAQKEQALNMEQDIQNANVQQRLEQDAMSIIAQMDSLAEQGKNPMYILDQLPDILKNRVLELLSMREQQNRNTQQLNNGVIPQNSTIPTQNMLQ